MNASITHQWSAGSFVLLLLAKGIREEAGVRNA